MAKKKISRKKTVSRKKTASKATASTNNVQLGEKNDPCFIVITDAPGAGIYQGSLISPKGTSQTRMKAAINDPKYDSTKPKHTSEITAKHIIVEDAKFRNAVANKVFVSQLLSMAISMRGIIERQKEIIDESRGQYDKLITRASLPIIWQDRQAVLSKTPVWVVSPGGILFNGTITSELGVLRQNVTVEIDNAHLDPDPGSLDMGECKIMPCTPEIDLAVKNVNDRARTNRRAIDALMFQQSELRADLLNEKIH